MGPLRLLLLAQALFGVSGQGQVSCSLTFSCNSLPAVRRSGTSADGFTTTWPGMHNLPFVSDVSLAEIAIIRTTPIDASFIASFYSVSNATFVQSLKKDHLEVDDVCSPRAARAPHACPLRSPPRPVVVGSGSGQGNHDFDCGLRSLRILAP